MQPFLPGKETFKRDFSKEVSNTQRKQKKPNKQKIT